MRTMTNSEMTSTKIKCNYTGCAWSDGKYCTGNGTECGRAEKPPETADMVNHPSHYSGGIEVIDYIRDKLTPEGFTEYCCGNVLKYISRWRKKDGVQDLKKAMVYLGWMIESAEKEGNA